MLLALLTNLLLLVTSPLRLLRRAFVSPRKGYVLLEIDGRVVDNAPPRPRLLARWTQPQKPPPLTLVAMHEVARLLAADARLEGLVVRVRSLAAGQSVLASMRAVLAKLRDAGKDVVVHAPMGADSDVMFLASGAKRIVVGPETHVAPLGYAVEMSFFKRALDRIGVEPQVFARGTYKSAAEPLVREDMSSAQREQLEEVIGTRHALLVEALAERCGGDRAKAAEWIDTGPHRASQAVELGLVDHVAYDDELDGLLGAPHGKRARFVAFGRYHRIKRPTKWRPLWPRPVVGLVEVHGPIVSQVRFSMGAIASEHAVVRAIRAARVNPRIAAVVLHVDSPGGSAIASDRIHHEVERLASEKPVVAYLSNVAASGGYYVAAPARAIVAQPQTITGSIGVVATHFVLRGLLDKLGVSTDVVKRGARADLNSPVRPLEDAERSVLEREVDAFYKTFVSVVARGRKRSVEDIEKLAQGRIYSGTEALARGLVDELGGLDRAIERATDLAGYRRLEPVIVRPTRFSIPPPPPIPRVAETMLAAVGLDRIVGERLALGLNVAQTELVLLYEPFGSDGRTWLDVT
ncbi:MAG: signal peptide peptidase SppA [Polyangiaceae bacterium]|nr:signal peptide peptidase SppA [Polyangiaceae bacterium]